MKITSATDSQYIRSITGLSDEYDHKDRTSKERSAIQSLADKRYEKIKPEDIDEKTGGWNIEKDYDWDYLGLGLDTIGLEVMELGKGGKTPKGKGKSKYYAIWDDGDYKATGLNSRSEKDLKDEMLAFLLDDTEDDDYKKMKKMSAYEIATIKGWTIEEQNEPFEDDSFSDDDEEGEDFGKGGRITTNEGVLDSFLTNLQKELEVGNLSTHYNEYDKEILLRNYGTLIATRKGDRVKITNKKFSKTTSIIQNKLEAMAKERNFYVDKVDAFEKGGKVKYSGSGDFDSYYSQHGAIITGGSYFN